MKIILLSSGHRKAEGRAFSLAWLGAVLGTLFAVTVTGALWLGYVTGVQGFAAAQDEASLASLLNEQMLKQRKELKETRQQTRAHLDALSLRMGSLQSQILRLDALGERLASAGSLDLEEFNFGQVPARGGLENPDSASSVELFELLSDMEKLSRTLEDREYKLDVMESLLLRSRVSEALTPAGKPVEKGWVSSGYGYRKDPFSGKKTFHRGVDIAGKKNSEVFAVASGIVTEAGPKTGYGYLAEIRHAAGYTTRYAHNSKIFVETGDLISKGDRIGLMGSTGRSTGPHVHFEVARNGKSLNPLKYLRK
ncbi:MAG: peptidoglycan DD-metalloendopeptidase family protein [Gammaproteobacteria bacterium]|nr:peptidoglycan DD-metalloendopeptidase family protein [Gammaproteobacteria bacterium]